MFNGKWRTPRFFVRGSFLYPQGDLQGKPGNPTPPNTPAKAFLRAYRINHWFPVVVPYGTLISGGVALGGGYIGWHRLTSHKLGNPTSPARGFTAGSGPLAEEPAEIAFRPFGTRFPLKSWWENVLGEWVVAVFWKSFETKKGQKWDWFVVGNGIFCWFVVGFFGGWVGSLLSIIWRRRPQTCDNFSIFGSGFLLYFCVEKTQRWDCFVIDGIFGLGCVLKKRIWHQFFSCMEH